MARNIQGSGGADSDASGRQRPPELNIFIALVAIIAVFEVLGWLIYRDSFLFNTRPDATSIFNTARLSVIILQVSIVGIIAIGVTQVILLGGIDLSSGSVAGATAMIAVSFAQVLTVNGQLNPKLYLPVGWQELPLVVPVVVGLSCGLIAGLINGALIAYARIPPFIATLGVMVTARGLAKWWSRGEPISFPTESYAAIGKGMMPVFIYFALAILFHLVMRYTLYGKHIYAIGSNEAAARMSGIKVDRHKVVVYTLAAILASVAAIVVSSKNLTAQASMGLGYELDAIAMAVIGGVSLSGGRGSITGTVLGSLIFGVIISGFTFLRLDAYYQEMVKGAIIVGAVVLDQWRQRRASARL